MQSIISDLAMLTLNLVLGESWVSYSSSPDSSVEESVDDDEPDQGDGGELHLMSRGNGNAFEYVKASSGISGARE